MILNNLLQTNLKILKQSISGNYHCNNCFKIIYIYWVIPFKNYTGALNANAHHRQALILSSPTKPM